ncbi:MAG: glycosyltransferase family 2 protein [Candidatus Moranbacteria bacterium]|nr:glycosyltransferase family 2 protein [Candidatus Moranbacteria bacterium]
MSEIASSGFGNIVVVDDGSSDDTFVRASEIGGVTAVRHLLNRGKGAAVRTGIEAARLSGADVVVTMDGDGQHDPADISTMVKLIAEGNDVVLGSRLKDHTGMPPYKVIHNRIGNLIVMLLYGLWVTDSQSGFRAYSKHALSKIRTSSDRFAYDSEVIREIRRNRLTFVETPIKVRYTEYSMNKQGRMTIGKGIRTFIRMIIS